MQHILHSSDIKIILRNNAINITKNILLFLYFERIIWQIEKMLRMIFLNEIMDNARKVYASYFIEISLWKKDNKLDTKKN